MTMRKQPDISVCMATYNGEAFVTEQIGSILSQLGENDELVISDDHSTDGTVELIKKCGDPRIRLIFNESIKGYTRNFENALRNATGEFIFISDQDDIWLENKVDVMRSVLERYDLIVSDARYVNRALEATLGSHFRLCRVNRGFIRQAIRPCYIGACMAFRRSMLDTVLPFPKSARYCAYDYWLTLVGESCYRVGLVDRELILYRRHGNNASPAGGKSPNSFVKKVLIRLYSLSELFRRVATRRFLNNEVRKEAAIEHS